MGLKNDRWPMADDRDHRWPMPEGRVSAIGHRSSAIFIFLFLFLLSPPRPLHAADPRETTVGMPAKLEEVVLPGPELEVKPIDDLKTPVVIRVTDVYPHGSAFRYDLVYYGLKPGSYDLTKFLQHKDGSPALNLPPVNVTIKSAMPADRIEPNRIEAKEPPLLGGYRRLLEVSAMAWSAGLVLILYLTRRAPAPAEIAATRPATLSERLRPLVEAAVAGRLGPGEHAELERLLIGYWRRRVGLEDADPARALAALRSHDEAGPVIRRLEEWLHRPGGSTDVDPADWLRPYQDIPAGDAESVKP
jgi:hypothetical protein